MATSYLTPGVYVEETPPGSRPIEGVGTSVAAFVGFAEMGPRNRPVLITNWSQYQNTFGGYVEGYYLPHSVYGYFANGGGTCFVINLAPSRSPQSFLPPATNGKAGTLPSLEVYATRRGLQTPGLTVQVEYSPSGALPAPPSPPPPSSAESPKSDGSKSDSAATGASDTPPPARPAARATSSVPPPTSTTPFLLKVSRGDTVLESFESATMDRESPRYVETLVNGVSQYVWLTPGAGRAPNLPAPLAGSYELQKPAPQPLAVASNDFVGDVRQRTGFDGLAAIDEITIVCAPDLMSAYKQELIDDTVLVGLQKAMLTHCEQMGDRVAILDAPPGKDPQDMLEWRDGSMIDSQYGALYYPWIKVLDPLDKTGKRILSVPPCGHMAGIWARTDSERGVHKAPANEVVRGALDVVSQVTDGEQGLMNPKGINCIRSFGTRGIRVWGARTVSSDAAWKYINVRRFFNWVEDSIQHGTQWAVFEPNDFSLWQRLKRDVTSFLLRPYRDGALFGATPDQAFYVKCDAETNPPDQVDAGMVVVEIGMCPVKPAEFVIFRVTQLATGELG
ncbi:MAG: phage tail sheath family protein [Chloroflexi bacterium]|nr:phage tail sheath family protein [Chloroflexota bacterium]MBV9896827.1 phage tail sheath family protein [Chloroflexota bacterium]